jgi:hypothetical protein
MDDVTLLPRILVCYIIWNECKATKSIAKETEDLKIFDDKKKKRKQEKAKQPQQNNKQCNSNPFFVELFYNKNLCIHLLVYRQYSSILIKIESHHGKEQTSRPEKDFTRQNGSSKIRAAPKAVGYETSKPARRKVFFAQIESHPLPD